MSAGRRETGRRETWALIAVKRFDRAKTRLSALLSPQDRAALAEAMFEDVLAALAGSPALSGALVVTSDPVAAAIAGRAGAAAIGDAFETGVSPAVAQGLKCLARWNAGRAIVVPSDVPLIAGAEIDAVAAALDEASVVLAPAERDGGTNALALSPIDAIPPSFGPDSLNRHAAAARAAGFDPRILRLAGGGFDIDTPDDLDLLVARGGGTRAGRLAREIMADTAAANVPLAQRIMTR